MVAGSRFASVRCLWYNAHRKARSYVKAVKAVSKEQFLDLPERNQESERISALPLPRQPSTPLKGRGNVNKRAPTRTFESVAIGRARARCVFHAFLDILMKKKKILNADFNKLSSLSLSRADIFMDSLHVTFIDQINGVIIYIYSILTSIDRY